MRCVHGLKVVMYFTAHTITPHNSGPDQCLSIHRKASNRETNVCMQCNSLHVLYTQNQCTVQYVRRSTSAHTSTYMHN